MSAFGVQVAAVNEIAEHVLRVYAQTKTLQYSWLRAGAIAVDIIVVHMSQDLPISIC